MPYGPFQSLAEETGYDLARLQQRFGVSFEQAAHRLTTLGEQEKRAQAVIKQVAAMIDLAQR